MKSFSAHFIPLLVDDRSGESMPVNPVLIIEAKVLGVSQKPDVSVQALCGVPPRTTTLHELVYCGPQSHAVEGVPCLVPSLPEAVTSTLSIQRGVLVWTLKREKDPKPCHILRFGLARTGLDRPPTLVVIRSVGDWEILQ